LFSILSLQTAEAQSTTCSVSLQFTEARSINSRYSSIRNLWEWNSNYTDSSSFWASISADWSWFRFLPIPTVLHILLQATMALFCDFSSLRQTGKLPNGATLLRNQIRFINKWPNPCDVRSQQDRRIWHFTSFGGCNQSLTTSKCCESLKYTTVWNYPNPASNHYPNHHPYGWCLIQYMFFPFPSARWDICPSVSLPLFISQLFWSDLRKNVYVTIYCEQLGSNPGFFSPHHLPYWNSYSETVYIPLLSVYNCLFCSEIQPQASR